MNKSTKINWKRIGVALIVGSTVTSILLAVIHYWFSFPIGRIYPSVGHLPALSLRYLIITLALGFIVGLPSVYALNRLGLLNGVYISMIGTFVGIGCVIRLIGPQPPPYAEGVLYGFGGLIMSVVFWSVYAGANKSLKKGRREAAPLS